MFAPQWQNPAAMARNPHDQSPDLQAEIDRISDQLGVRPIQVGLRTNDGLNVYLADDGTYHFTFYERGELGFDRTGSLDDLLYWYCEGIVSSRAALPRRAQPLWAPPSRCSNRSTYFAITSTSRFTWVPTGAVPSVVNSRVVGIRETSNQ